MFITKNWTKRTLNQILCDLVNSLIWIYFFVTKYLFQELKPTLDELGIATLEELGYDKPELALPNPYEIH